MWTVKDRRARGRKERESGIVRDEPITRTGHAPDLSRETQTACRVIASDRVGASNVHWLSRALIDIGLLESYVRHILEQGTEKVVVVGEINVHREGRDEIEAVARVDLFTSSSMANSRVSREQKAGVCYASIKMRL
jgi:hypothetical protein